MTIEKPNESETQDNLNPTGNGVKAVTSDVTYHQPMMANPDGFGTNTGECGDTVEISLMARDDKLVSVQYQTDGCMATHLCALAVVELTQGHAVDHAWRIKPEHVIRAVPDLPDDHHHCAELAAGALYRALVDLRNNQRKPWAKLYRTDKSR